MVIDLTFEPKIFQRGGGQTDKQTHTHTDGHENLQAQPALILGEGKSLYTGDHSTCGNCADNSTDTTAR